jgi:DtxR family Mn-dependent transcriptional regulator
MGKVCERLTRRREDYLEAVFELAARDGVARVRDIALRTRVSKSSVTAALKQLARAGLIEHDPYQLVRLTPRGHALAGQVRRKHDVLRGFLVEVLSIEPPRAEANACRMEHVVDDQVLRRLVLLSEFLRDRPPPVADWVERFAAYCRKHDSSRAADSAPDRPRRPGRGH